MNIALSTHEASWWWDFDPIYTLLFDLYHKLRTNILSDVYHYCVSGGGYPMVPVQWTGWTPAGLHEAFRAECCSIVVLQCCS